MSLWKEFKGFATKRNDPTTKTCAECLEEIRLAARRCRACTSQQPS